MRPLLIDMSKIYINANIFNSLNTLINMNINKSQGQSLSMAGIDLTEECSVSHVLELTLPIIRLF